MIIRSMPVPSSLNPSSSSNSLPPNYPTRKDGRPKSRFTWEENLSLLDPHSSVESTKSRLKDFADLFAPRKDQPIATRAGQDHRSFSTLPCLLTHKHIVRHLLADRRFSLNPKWFGARSDYSALFFCLDIDPDRDHKTPHASFSKRCVKVERALRKMGIDVRDPRQVLIQLSPSGGRHYYVFFDQLNPIEEYHRLLQAAGLRHISSQIEFFPSMTQGLRLPFGHLPGRDHDPNAWIQFTDDYKNGRIRRHSLNILMDRLSRVKKKSSRDKSPSEKPSTSSQEARECKILGVPKRFQTRSSSARRAITGAYTETERYRELIENGIKLFQDAKDLERLGIRLPGTRNTALNLLAAHHVWFLHETAEEAAEYLIRWSMDSRHDSKDIQSDLETVTTIVSKQLGYMCSWYADKKKTSQAPRASALLEKLYSREELDALRPSVLGLAEPDRVPQAHFLLHFLSYAKTQGWPALDHSGREAAVAINEVVKKWPGCRGKNYYKVRMTRAEVAGIFRMVREKWHNHAGPGRARTYRLTVPLTDQAEASIDYDGAIAYLSGRSETAFQPPIPEILQNVAREGSNHEPSRRQSGDHPCRGEDHPGPLRPGSATGSMGTSSRQCDPEPATAQGLPDTCPGSGPTVPPIPAPRVSNSEDHIDRMLRRKFPQLYSVEAKSQLFRLHELGRSIIHRISVVPERQKGMPPIVVRAIQPRSP